MCMHARPVCMHAYHCNISLVMITKLYCMSLCSIISHGELMEVLDETHAINNSV